MPISSLARVPMSALLLLPILAACSESPSQTQGTPPPPPQVTVAKPVSRMVVDQDEYVGRFIAVDSVEVRARVSGYLDAIHFRDGQTVKKGDLLFTIDRRPFQTALDQAQANLAQARANLAFTETDLARGHSLAGNSVISRQTLDQRTLANNVAKAMVVAQEAAVRQTTLDLEFTELRAPVAGRIGDRRVSPGNLVTGGTTGTTSLLATIQSTDPIRFEFTFDEGSYLRYLRHAKNGADIASNGTTVSVKLKLLDEPTFAHEGKMDFVDNAIDGLSGTIRGRAEFANPDGTLTPGMFGRVQVSAKPASQALVVPDVAIGTEQVRKFVFVVDSENVARPKYVTLGAVVDGLRVIEDGLGPDDRVIVNGLSRVRPGIKVAPQGANIAAAADASTQAK